MQNPEVKVGITRAENGKNKTVQLNKAKCVQTDKINVH